MKLRKIGMVVIIVSLLMGIMVKPTIAEADNPITQTYYTGDPAPMVTSDGIFYCYTGHDEDIIENAYGQDYSFFTMKDWRAYSSTDMVNWTDQGTVLKLSDFSWADQNDARAWASQVIERNGKFYFYVCAVVSSEYKNSAGVNGYFGIGVAVSDRPDGPFVDPLGKPLICGAARDIDPTVWIDDDGQAYLYYGQDPIRYVLLNEDMISYDESIGIISEKPTDIGLEGYVEGPWFYSRITDGGAKLYYMIYAGGGGSEDIRYATSNSPTGPWNYGGVIMEPGTIAAVDDGKVHSSFTIHAGIVDYKGHSYFIYHNAALANGQGYHRSTCIEEFNYNSDGTIPLMNMTLNDRKAIGTLNPYVRVEAETICWEYGVKTNDEINESGEIDVHVYNMHDEDYIKLESVDFGQNGADTFTAAIKDISEDAGASIELYIKDNDNIEEMNCLNVQPDDKVGTLKLINNVGTNQYTEYTTKLDKKITGVHDLYLVFKGNYKKPEKEEDPSSVISEEDTGMFKFDYWKFGEVNVADNIQNDKTISVSDNIQPVNNQSNTLEDTKLPIIKKGKIKSVKNKKNRKIEIKINKMTKNTRYEVWYSTKKNFKNKRILKTSNNKVILKKVKKGKIYYIKVRGYVNMQGNIVAGKFSSVKKIKIKR